jgi:cytochrome c peroxidase
MRRLGLAIVLLGITPAAISALEPGTASPQFRWNLPRGFPTPSVPADNPMSAPRAELGRYLFYDTRLSGNGKQACASCHQQKYAFADNRAFSTGSTGEAGVRRAMSLVNIAYAPALTWSNPAVRTLEDQALVPMFGNHPVEMGLSKDNRFLKTLQSDPVYTRLFPRAFPSETQPFTLQNVTRAIACFERTIISARSPYDRYHFLHDDTAISSLAKRGEELFFSWQYNCFHCHGGFNFADSEDAARGKKRWLQYSNTGLYNIPGPTSYPAANPGIYEFTKKPQDVGKFKAPSLRNVELHPPYMHDGSIATLEGVIEHYASAGRKITEGPNKGDGSLNPNKDPRIVGFPLTPNDKKALVAFLCSLTDRSVISDPRFGNPWKPNNVNGKLGTAGH